VSCTSSRAFLRLPPVPYNCRTLPTAQSPFVTAANLGGCSGHFAGDVGLDGRPCDRSGARLDDMPACNICPGACAAVDGSAPRFRCGALHSDQGEVIQGSPLWGPHRCIADLRGDGTSRREGREPNASRHSSMISVNGRVMKVGEEGTLGAPSRVFGPAKSAY